MAGTKEKIIALIICVFLTEISDLCKQFTSNVITNKTKYICLFCLKAPANVIRMIVKLLYCLEHRLPLLLTDIIRIVKYI